MPLLQNQATTRSYLARELERISDADPQILADYILALLRHDKPVAEMKTICVGNLSDFLHERTVGFVDALFDYLVSGIDKGGAAPATGSGAVPQVVQMGPASDVASVFQANLCEQQHRGDAVGQEDSRHVRRRNEREQSPDRRRRERRPPRTYAAPYEPAVPPRRQHPRTTVSTSTRLVVDRIPIEHCSIAAVNAYFQRFGTLTNVTVSPEQRRARIQFGTPEEASRAYQSAEAIFENRFVKLYFDKERDDPAIPAASSSKDPVSHKYISPAAMEQQQAHAAAVKRQDALKSLLALQRQQQELLLRYIEQQKALMTRLEEGSMEEAGKADLMNSIRNVDTLIGGMRDSIISVETKVAEMQHQGSTSPTMMATEDRVPILRGGPRPAAAATAKRQPSRKLDMRPTSLALKPFPQGSSPEELKSIFNVFGEVRALDVDASSGALILRYGQRHEAEKAFSGIPKMEPFSQVEVQWCQQAPPQTMISSLISANDADVTMNNAEEGEQQ